MPAENDREHMPEGEMFRSFEDTLEELAESVGRLRRSKASLSIPSININCDDEDRRNALRSILLEMASVRPEDALTDSDIQGAARFFEALYGGTPKYRHSYADVCDIVFSLNESRDGGIDDLDEGVPYQVNSLADNMRTVYAKMVEGRALPSTQAESVLKLCDHIELERTRLKHFVEQSRQLREFRRERDELERDFSKRADSMRTEYIAILGVFAAIVLAFNGAVSFSSSSLSALGTASGIRALAFLCALVGLSLIDTISVLLAFIWKMASNERRAGLGKWPIALIAFANFILVAVMACCAALSLPCVRGTLGL